MAATSEHKRHAHYSTLLERHLDGELGELERDELFDHLETCEDCRRVLEAEERLLARLQEIPRLVAPSDLRARILKEAARARFEQQHTLTEDSRFAALLSPPVDEEEDGEEEVPRFESIPVRTRRTRLQRTWRRYSPALATAFLFIAAGTTILTANLSAVPALDHAQAHVRHGIAIALGAVLPLGGRPADEDRAVATAEESVPAAESNVPDDTEISRSQALFEQRSAWISGYLAGRFDEISGKVQRFTEAAARVVPDAAESSPARVTAVVIRRMQGATAYSFDADDFTDSIRDTAQTKLDGRIAGVDQFAFDGHRYRCYTMEVADNRFESMVESLRKFRTPADREILRALNEQGRAGRGDGVAFYSASDTDFQTTIEHLAQIAADDGQTRRREIELVFVE